MGRASGLASEELSIETPSRWPGSEASRRRRHDRAPNSPAFGARSIPSAVKEPIALPSYLLNPSLQPDAQGTSRLRIRVGQQGYASKSSASRIRRRSRTHLAGAYALDGPMQDRLWRWPIRIVIARIPRGTHDRTDETGAGRVCANTPGALLQAAKRKPFGAVISIRSHHHGSARTCHRRRRSRRKPAAGRRDACIPYAWHNEHAACMLASSPTWAGRATATPMCDRVMCEHLDARFPTRSVRVGQISREFSAHTPGPFQFATNAGLRFDGRDVLASRASIPSYRWTYRGRMRGVGATCTAPKTHGRLKCISAPEYCKFWRDTKSASKPLRQSGVSRLAATDGAGIRRQIDGIRGGVRHCASTLKIRATTRVFRGPSDRQAPIFRQESEGGIGRIRRQPGGESGRH